MSRSRDDIHLIAPGTKVWDRLEAWHKAAIVFVGLATALFGGGVAFQKARASIVFTATQSEIDERQDSAIRAVQDDSGRIHVTLDDLHDEVRGMRLDLRYFDPRLRGGGLAVLPPEEPARPAAHPTPTQDPSMGMPVPPTPAPSKTP